MRDVKRIRKFCNELADFWETWCPDWRFWQVVSYLAQSVHPEYDPFFVEEHEWSQRIRICKEAAEERLNASR